jgi:cyclophilin family peptidyl-prolyl cis-trans isomerase
MLLMVVGACHKKPSVERNGTPAHKHSPRLMPLASAEVVRDARAVTIDDLMSRDVEVRRRAMQALARIADSTARPALERGLSDEDGQVVAWAAFGLGRACEKDSEQAVAQLALRAATWSASEHAPEQKDRLAIDPISSIADALGRCSTPSAEATLRGWLRLDGYLAQRAALALGTIAAKQHRLENTTLVALLDSADSKGKSVTTALFPLTRLSAVETNVQKRLLSVATKSLLVKSDAQRYAIRALPLAGENAAPTLERVLCDKVGFASELRADAARGLTRLGDAGQQSLGRALMRLLPRALDINSDWLTSAEFSTVAQMLEDLNSFENEVRPILESLARLTLPAAAPTAIKRRLLVLRCQSASILAGNALGSPLLRACDPDPDGREGALAVSRVLGRASIRGYRAQLFDKLTHSTDLVVRESALRWLRSHPEVRDSPRILADALASGLAGVVATAAGILAEHPERAQSQTQNSKLLSTTRVNAHDFEKSNLSPHPTPELLLALGKATHHTWESDAIDVRSQLLDAVAALGALSERVYLEEQCHSVSAVLRKHAEVALHRFGDTRRRCGAQKFDLPSTVVLADIGPIHLRFHTDIGPLDLWLEPTLCPMAATRLLELAKAGFYNNMPVHRVVAGFVVQMGDRAGDGFGSAGSEPLRDELSPLEFRTNDVGLALSGPDTASSQFFVVLGPHPHLDGEYTRVGHTDDGWNRLVVGDLIQSVEQIL